MLKTVVMGQGYVGLPFAMAAARFGHKVIGYEPDKKRCDLLRAGISYIDDVHNIQIQRNLREGTYKPTTNEIDLFKFDVAVITVPTPLKDHAPDLSYVAAAALTVAQNLQPGALVVLESTTHPGTTRDFLVPILETSGLKAGKNFHVAFSPERIDPGNQEWRFENTPKIVAGLTPACRNVAAAFYSTILDNVVVAETLEEAELAKVFENTFRQVNIALVNELARMSHLIGADVYNVLELCATKPFGFTKFTPSAGVGGHCIPCDPVYLTHHLRTQLGAAFRLVELAQEINNTQPAYVVQRLQDGLNERDTPLRHSQILALGAAYKPDTADMRESPAVAVVEQLRAKGARVTVVDPYFDEEGIDARHVIPSSLEDDLNCGDYDAVVVLTPHSVFDLQEVADSASYVLDTRGVMPMAPHIERL